MLKKTVEGNLCTSAATATGLRLCIINCCTVMSNGVIKCTVPRGRGSGSDEKGKD
jgi:hypothetical protein